MKVDPVITVFGPVRNPRGNVIRLHRPTTIERSYAKQGRQFVDQTEQTNGREAESQGDRESLAHPIDLRVNQLKLRVHPPIAWWEVVTMMLVAAFIGVLLATGGVL